MADVQQIKKGIEMVKNIVNNKKKNINIYRKKQYIKTLDWQMLLIFNTTWHKNLDNEQTVTELDWGYGNVDIQKKIYFVKQKQRRL